MTVTILTVDDSRTMRDMLRMALVDAGFRVVQAEDGLHGLDGIFESGTGQRQAVGKRLAHRLMAIGARRALERHRSRRGASGGFNHVIDKGLRQRRVAAAHGRPL